MHRSIACFLVLVATVLSACQSGARLRPELRAAVAERNALGLCDALEDLIDKQRATESDRRAAYEQVTSWSRQEAAYGYARASLAGRVAELQGLAALGLLAEMELWARKSLELDPAFRDGAARRLLGTLYALAPASLLQHGDSEEGVELLEAQVEAYPTNTANHLRLAEALVALDDQEGAYPSICHSLANQASLRASERRLLSKLVEACGGHEVLSCNESPGAERE